MSWLPQGYEVPQGSSQFMKLSKGANRFRIIGSPVLGFEVWEDTAEGRKPHRFKDFKDAVASPFSDKIKHFWAFAVWNYDSKQVQVLQITQKSIMKAIEALQIDDDWGSPENYDLVVNRSGDGLETEYTVQPKPAKKIEASVIEAYEASKIDLESLFAGNYPMSGGKNENEATQKTTATNETVMDSDEVAGDVPF